jgi:branched-chain amino acid transport system substrate-binding protein
MKVRFSLATRPSLAWVAIVLLASNVSLTPAFAADPIKIGLIAALSGASAQSGEAITRGLTIAVEEINESGGLLDGRKIELVIRDDQSKPTTGLVAVRELIFNEGVTAFFGGIDSPVSLAMVPVANQEEIPFIGVWAAATNITQNGSDPNYAFRVSAVDDLVSVKLLDYANQKAGATKVGLMLINNPWGESNQKGLEAADAVNESVEIVGIEKFESADVDMTPQLSRLRDAGAEALILVVNAPPAAQMMKTRERMDWMVPVVSHWGISGGRFPELAGPTAGDAHFVQTYSFFGDQSDVAKAFMVRLMAKYSDVTGPQDVFSPVGTANAYDAMRLLGLAIEQAGSLEGDAIRLALEDLDAPYEGLIKIYDKPFSAEQHDALGPDDYIMVHYQDEEIVPTE